VENEISLTRSKIQEIITALASQQDYYILELIAYLEKRLKENENERT